jgi:Fe-S cluster assembly iron-binding protein IscA
MLTVTDDAATAIRTLAAQNDLPAQTGVRISSTTGESGATALGLSVAEGPLPEDEVIEVQGARVFVDSAVAADLEDKALDAQITEQGQVQFMLANQPG